MFKVILNYFRTREHHTMISYWSYSFCIYKYYLTVTLYVFHTLSVTLLLFYLYVIIVKRETRFLITSMYLKLVLYINLKELASRSIFIFFMNSIFIKEYHVILHQKDHAIVYLLSYHKTEIDCKIFQQVSNYYLSTF